MPASVVLPHCLAPVRFTTLRYFNADTISFSCHLAIIRYSFKTQTIIGYQILAQRSNRHWSKSRIGSGAEADYSPQLFVSFRGRAFRRKKSSQMTAKRTHLIPFIALVSELRLAQQELPPGERFELRPIAAIGKLRPPRQNPRPSKAAAFLRKRGGSVLWGVTFGAMCRDE